MIAADSHGHGDDGRRLSDSWISDHDDGRAQEEGVHQRQNVLREGDVEACSRKRELILGNGPGNTTRLILAHVPDFDFWPTCQGGAGVRLVRQDPVGLLIESVAVGSEGVDVTNALCKLVILR